VCLPRERTWSTDDTRDERTESDSEPISVKKKSKNKNHGNESPSQGDFHADDERSTEHVRGRFFCFFKTFALETSSSFFRLRCSTGTSLHGPTRSNRLDRETTVDIVMKNRVARSAYRRKETIPRRVSNNDEKKPLDVRAGFSLAHAGPF